MVVVAFGAAILGHTNVVSTGFIGWTIVLSILAFIMPVVITVFVIILVIVVARWIHKKRKNQINPSAC